MRSTRHWWLLWHLLGKADCVVAGLVMDSKYDPVAKTITGHAALGGTAIGKLWYDQQWLWLLTTFLSLYLSAWVCSVLILFTLGHLVSRTWTIALWFVCLSCRSFIEVADVLPRTQLRTIQQDSVTIAMSAARAGKVSFHRMECVSFGTNNRVFIPAFCVGIGAFLHEVGHAFTLTHTPSGIMKRGFRNLNRTFMIKEEGKKSLILAPGKFIHRPSESSCIVVLLLISPFVTEDENEAHWHILDAYRLRHHPFFRLPKEPVELKSSEGSSISITIIHHVREEILNASQVPACTCSTQQSCW